MPSKAIGSMSLHEQTKCQCCAALSGRIHRSHGGRDCHLRFADESEAVVTASLQATSGSVSFFPSEDEDVVLCYGETRRSQSGQRFWNLHEKGVCI